MTSMAGPERTVAIAEILAERDRQDEKWGQQNHSNDVWMVILAEELGELAMAINEMRFPGGKGATLEDVRKETTHVAAVAMAMVECFERLHPAPGRQIGAPGPDLAFWGIGGKPNG